MSGAFGWGGKDRRDDYGTVSNSGGGFSRAVDAYNRPARNPNAAPAPSGTQSYVDAESYVDADYKSVTIPPTPAIDLSPKRMFKSTAKNVLIVATDVTGSLLNWREDIFKFLPLLYKEAQQYLGDDLEIMFIAYGDCDFNDRIEVASFGKGQILDTHLTALYKTAYGGGNQAESTEVVAYFIHERVDTSSAKNVYAFFITDEKCQPKVSESEVRDNLDLSVNPELRDAQTVFRSLFRRMEVFVVFAETGSYDREVPNSAKVFADWWRNMVGAERVCPMPRANLVVETMLAVVAKTTGQLAVYTQNYQTRRGGTQYGMVNKSHVDRSIAFVPGAGPSTPNLAPKSRLLIDTDDKN